MSQHVFHQPVLSKEVVDYLNVRPGQRYVDATIGGGGHAQAIVERGGVVLGIDVDAEAIAAVKDLFARHNWKAQAYDWQKLRQEGLRIEVGSGHVLMRANFVDLTQIMTYLNWHQVAGFVFDLGVSWHQLHRSQKGLSFLTDAPLDMRIDPSLSVTAADLVNSLTKKELYELFKKFGQDPNSGRVAFHIDSKRRIAPVTTTAQLTGLIEEAVGKKGKTHKATRIFQALRIAVNSELFNLRQALEQVVDRLQTGGRIAVISYHSGEDGIVKNWMKQQQGNLRIITKKPVKPTAWEIKQNHKARSAKLRVSQRT